jgi:hypothetical protein
MNDPPKRPERANEDAHYYSRGLSGVEINVALTRINHASCRTLAVGGDFYWALKRDQTPRDGYPPLKQYVI